MFQLNGKPLSMDVAFEHEGVQYPANWLRNSTFTDRLLLGIEEVSQQPRPDDRYHYVSQNEDGTWTSIPKPHDQIVGTIWEDIKQERERRSNGGVQVGDKWFHSDLPSRIQQLGLVQFGPSVPPVEWKTMDGTFVTMSQSLAHNIFLAIALHDQAVFAVAEQHRQAMEALEEPWLYDWSTGWPMTYQDYLQAQ